MFVTTRPLVPTTRRAGWHLSLAAVALWAVFLTGTTLPLSVAGQRWLERMAASTFLGCVLLLSLGLCALWRPWGATPYVRTPVRASGPPGR